MSIILGRPFLNIAGAVIDWNKGNVHSINSIGKTSTITIGGFEFPLPTVKKKYDILLGMCISPLR